MWHLKPGLIFLFCRNSCMLFSDRSRRVYRPQGQKAFPPCLRPNFLLAAPVTSLESLSSLGGGGREWGAQSWRLSLLCLAMRLLRRRELAHWRMGICRGGGWGVTALTCICVLTLLYDARNWSYRTIFADTGNEAISTRFTRFTSRSGTHSSSNLMMKKEFLIGLSVKKNSQKKLFESCNHGFFNVDSAWIAPEIDVIGWPLSRCFDSMCLQLCGLLAHVRTTNDVEIKITTFSMQ